MDPQAFVDGMSVATPCHVDWDTMQGDDQVRFCDRSRKHVYNVASLSAAEVLDLVREKEDGLCARFYRRVDGTVVTRDCRPPIRKPFQYSLRSLMLLVTSFASLFGAGRWLAEYLEQREAERESTQGVHLLGDVVSLPSIPSVPSASAPEQ